MAEKKTADKKVSKAATKPASTKKVTKKSVVVKAKKPTKVVVKTTKTTKKPVKKEVGKVKAKEVKKPVTEKVQKTRVETAVNKEVEVVQVEQNPVVVKTAPVKVEYSVDLRDMLEAGCHFGHQARRWNPKMIKYIYAEKDGVHIFDLAKSAELIVSAMEFVRDWVASGKEIVFVGSKRQASAIVREEAVAVGAPFVSVRWMGGLLTNWEEMKKRIKRLNTLKEQRESGELTKKYTKKERVLIDREIAKLERFFGGIAHLNDKPETLFIVDTHREITAVKEATVKQVPIVGMVDSNADPDPVSYVIPVNDDAVRSIKLVVNKIAQAYADGKSKRGKVVEKSSEERK
jgi:small subunit ribosomal protein S2